MGKLALNPHEKEVLSRYAEVDGLLVVPQPHRLDLTDGAIVVACADGDQMDDFFDDLRSMSTEIRVRPRPHLLTEHGGALALSPDWHDLRRPNRAQRLFEDIIDARDMKAIYTVLLFAHAPCGKARECGVSITTTRSATS